MKGRLVDLINLFGQLGGFDFLKKRICEGELTVNILSFLLRLFGLCSSFLTERVRNDYIIAIVSLCHLCSVIPGRDDIETFRLKMIFRLLQIPSFFRLAWTSPPTS
ncbi:PREDICTED: probable ubiquitin carboxyl-terminal hydrolase FAF-Y isoform X2 [Amphimedon queenslandica]|uniref:Uncharacterized protein n=1 Tax=Amphimedon queenslandica TaxID=400682 RepID=A0AAN0JW63_AMPQE|nr:PREDICTED: probable ubiquitin carboxyl-terminal hydrolase FAF-Y isoform X2 [Amphimedon queenslandica]|eukprot:XP_019861157.1 PREDICTED: probable ubiquitin carboxyl-terminal hydrolase FAF-Y isoform X2 [Amphimedon queenslandica]